MVEWPRFTGCTHCHAVSQRIKHDQPVVVRSCPIFALAAKIACDTKSDQWNRDGRLREQCASCTVSWWDGVCEQREFHCWWKTPGDNNYVIISWPARSTSCCIVQIWHLVYIRSNTKYRQQCRNAYTDGTIMNGEWKQVSFRVTWFQTHGLFKKGSGKCGRSKRRQTQRRSLFKCIKAQWLGAEETRYLRQRARFGRKNYGCISMAQ